MSERTYFVAKTAAGVPIETFADRDRALAWADARGDLFPGWQIASVTEITMIRSRVIRRDRARLEQVA